MGQPMASHLLDAGYQLCVYNRTRAKARALEEKGAIWCTSPAEVAAQSSITFTIVGYPADVEEVYLAESYANLCWTACLGFPGPYVDALYLHVSRAVHGHPFGIVTVLDYTASAQDAERFAARTRREAVPYVRRAVKHYRTHVQIGSTLDFIKILRESR